MNQKKLLSGYGLKYNPFLPDVPTEALLCTRKIESFCWRIENAHIREGGFALITGEPGTGKSALLRILAERLGKIPEVRVVEMEHPQSGVADFYRELGDAFNVSLRPHNRWCSFKSLRERYEAHIESTLARPVLLVDEAQEMHAKVMNELRILSSTRFDSRAILTVVLAGDGRLVEKLRREELIPLGSRVRTRLVMEPASRQELLSYLEHLVRTAGNAKLMTRPLMEAVADHAMGNPRVLCGMAADLLVAGMEREVDTLDEKLFFELFDPSGTEPVERPKRTARKGRSR
jgi:type II secretory pathway predicted ATPase ExeA